jgi:hypothetical protein
VCSSDLCDNVEKHPNNNIFARLFKRSCRRKQCPICFEQWASAEAERALIRIASKVLGFSDVKDVIYGLKKACLKEPRRIFHESLVSSLEDKIKAKKKAIHVVLSPPDGLITEDRSTYIHGKELAYHIVKESGLFGGACVFHPYRLKCSECGSAIPDYTKACLKCGCSRFEWFFSPHFHIVGFGWIQNTKEGYERHGWIVKNLKTRDSIFATFQYLLSHAGVSKFHTTTWFGSLAYNKLKSPVLGSVLEICPFCERILLPLKWCGLDKPPDLAYDEESKDPYANEFLDEKENWRTF